MTTPNHDYSTPSKGQTNWHLDLNSNFEKIDEDVAIRDTEARKGDHKPKQGIKYEAIDSGAIYYGNGSSWVLSDRKVESVEASRIHTVPEGSIQDIADAMNKYKRIKLEEGAVYTADKEVVVDPGEYCFVNARGATLKSTATGDVGILSFEQLAKAANSVGYAKRFEWHGGVFIGAGNGVTESGIRMTDVYGCKALIGGVDEVTNGIHVRNYEKWSETNRVGYKRTKEADTESNITSAVRLDGASVTGGPGTASMRDGEVYIPFGNSSGDPVLHQQGCGLWGGKIFLKAFAPDDGTVWFHDPSDVTGSGGINSSGNANAIAYVEFEQGNQNTIGIDLVSGPPPTFIAPRFTGVGNQIKTDGIQNSIPLSIDNSGFRTYDDSIGFEFNGQGTGSWETSIPVHSIRGPSKGSSAALGLHDKKGNRFGELRRSGESGIEDQRGIGLASSYESGSRIHFVNTVDEEYAGISLGSGVIKEQRGDPEASEISSGDSMIYQSDGSETGSAGDLVRAYNDDGTVKTQIIAPLSNAT